MAEIRRPDMVFQLQVVDEEVRLLVMCEYRDREFGVSYPLKFPLQQDALTEVMDRLCESVYRHIDMFYEAEEKGDG